MRLAVADAMRRSWTRPLASAGRPYSWTPHQAQAKFPLRPGITLYFARALALAWRKARMRRLPGGENILSPKTIDIGIAAQVADGVMVPVLRRVNERTMEELLEDYNRLIAQARRRRLAPEDSTGGIATVTNFGGFGLTFAAPMPMPSESIILGVGAVTKTPVWSDEVEAFIPISKANIVATETTAWWTGGHRPPAQARGGIAPAPGIPVTSPVPPASRRMTTDPPVLGLVAGDGVYPEYIVRGARRRMPELRIVAVGFKGETNPAVIPLCDAYQEFSVGQISKPFTFLKKARRKERHHGRRHQSEEHSFPPSGPSRPFRIDAHAGKNADSCLGPSSRKRKRKASPSSRPPPTWRSTCRSRGISPDRLPRLNNGRMPASACRRPRKSAVSTSGSPSSCTAAPSSPWKRLKAPTTAYAAEGNWATANRPRWPKWPAWGA